MTFSNKFLKTFSSIINNINYKNIDYFAEEIRLAKLNNGRLFFVGNGGGVATCSHAVNDFRKICNIESYNVSENVSELSARINDDGFDTTFIEWLKTSKLNRNDIIFILSVGGGNKEKNISGNIIKAIDYGRFIGCKILSITGRDGGYSAKTSTLSLIIPTMDEELVTPMVESIHSVILHLLVSHPLLKENQTKWESENGQSAIS